MLGSQPAAVYHCVPDSPLPEEENNAGGIDPALCGGSAPTICFPCSDSPALPRFNNWNQLVGALEAGCGPCATAVERESWGSIKAMHR